MSQEDVQEVVSMSPERRRLGLACVNLKHRKQAADQPQACHGSLRDLELAELATWTPKHGWELTEAGRKLAETFRRAAKTKPKTGGRS